MEKKIVCPWVRLAPNQHTIALIALQITEPDPPVYVDAAHTVSSPIHGRAAEIRFRYTAVVYSQAVHPAAELSLLVCSTGVSRPG